ncbi:MAG: hypothetical protein ACI835_001855 [Planctomycetota bacterium]
MPSIRVEVSLQRSPPAPGAVMTVRSHFSLSLITLGSILLTLGCTPESSRTAAPTSSFPDSGTARAPDPEPSADPDTTPAAEVVEEPVAPDTTPAEEDSPQVPSLTQEELAVRRKQRIEKMFGELIDPLTEASEAYQRHDALDESNWFSEDQGDNQEHIDDLLDQAIKVLGVSDISTTRDELRLLESEIGELEAKILEHREARLAAPLEDDLSKLEKTYKTSKEDFGERIEDAEDGIRARKDEIANLERRFVTELRAIGVDISLESARSLLSSVAGDDFIEMCVVFENVRGVTVQLQELTEQSGESLDAAKRYYGSYVVLIKLMDRLQHDFIRRVKDDMIPRLEQYGQEADELIEKARDNMAEGGNRTIGEQNIASNQLTIQATGIYIQYLQIQAEDVRHKNQRVRIDLKDAVNTYDTVLLSSQVAELLKEGSRNFSALLELQVPELRGFDNAELRAEFQRLTSRMTRID